MNVRQALLEMYTDQVMDNLIRAKTGLPFVQLAYTNVQVQDVDSVMGNMQNTYTAASDRASNPANVITGVVRHFTNALQLTGNAKRDRTMSLRADPVTDHNDIYELYLSFALNSEHFACTDKKPGCAVHVIRKCGKKYYWVPVEAAAAFQELCLKTTFMRGPETTPPPVYYDRTITNVMEYRRDPEDKEKNQPMTVYAALQLDQPVPNADGSVLATLADGRKIVLGVKQYSQRLPIDKDPLPPKGTPTKWLQTDWHPALTGYDVENLRNVKVRILLPEYPPPLQQPATELKNINDNLDQIRLNVVNLRNNSN